MLPSGPLKNRSPGCKRCKEVAMTPHNVSSPADVHHSAIDHAPQPSGHHTPAGGSSNAGSSRGRIVFGVVVGVGLVVGAGVFLNIIPTPWKVSAAAPPAKKEAALSVELVPGSPYTIAVPEDVRRSLGIRKGDKDVSFVAQVPTQTQTLVLPGSTALDPTKLMRVRARFAPAEVVEIGSVTIREANSPDGQSHKRELRPGDKVEKGQLLGVFYSVDVGSKKNDLVDALLQLKLDQQILDRAEKVTGAVSEVFLLNARRNVESDRNAIARALSNLKTWNVPDEDIQAVYKEAEAISGRKGERDKKVEADWPRVKLLAPADGTIVERNVTAHETVVDNTVNLFQIADVDRLLVIANAPEDELPTLQALAGKDRRWNVRTVGAEGAKCLDGSIDEIGYLIDPNQHTAILKGTIENPGGALRAGQFVSASIQIPKPTGVVEVPIDALIEDGQQSLVFVQPDPKKAEYTLRRVVVKRRFDEYAYVASTIDDALPPPTAEEKEIGVLPREPLRRGEAVLVSGGLELKVALQDLMAKNAKPAKELAKH
jgi:cobalt-zinc-cadmium efflux system membrane fusion protein